MAYQFTQNEFFNIYSKYKEKFAFVKKKQQQTNRSNNSRICK